MLEDINVRGAFITKASELWKSMTEEEKAEYKPPIIVHSSTILPATDEEVGEYIKTAIHNTSKKTKKERKPRGPTPFNTFCKTKKEHINSLLEVKGVRGAFIAKASQLWKSMTKEEQATYKKKDQKLPETTLEATE